MGFNVALENFSQQVKLLEKTYPKTFQEKFDAQSQSAKVARQCIEIIQNFESTLIASEQARVALQNWVDRLDAVSSSFNDDSFIERALNVTKDCLNVQV